MCQSIPPHIKGISQSVSRCGEGGGGRAGVMNDHPKRGSRSCTVPARQPRVTRDSGWLCPMRLPIARAQPRSQQRWIGDGPETPKGTPPERSVHRGPCGAGFKHRARDAGELADLRLRQSGRRFIEKHRPACASREMQARGSVEDPASRASLSFSGCALPQTSDANRAARMRAAALSLPLSRLRERVPERSEGGRGFMDFRFQKEPSPGSTLRASPPSPASGRGETERGERPKDEWNSPCSAALVRVPPPQRNP